MKRGRKTFVFGVIVGVAEVILSLAFIALGYFLVRYVYEIYENGVLLYKETEVRGFGLTMMLVAGICAAVAFAVTVLCCAARSAIKKDPQRKAASVIMIVAGIFGNIFFTVSGILSLPKKDE